MYGFAGIVKQAGRLADEARKALERARARLGSLSAVRAELLTVVEPAQEEAGRGQEAVARSRRGRAGKGALRPEQFAMTTTGRAPPKRPSEVGR